MKLGRIMQLIGQHEWEVEQCRQDLCHLESYELYTVFKRLDRDRKGHLDSDDIRCFMLDN